jgi:IS30 family transposase
MIRRSIPKGSDIGLRSEQEVRKIQDWMNTYPRKLLGGKTPLGRLKAGMGEGLTAPPFLEPPPR